MRFPIKVTPDMNQPIHVDAPECIPDVTGCKGVMPCNPVYCSARRNYNTKRDINPQTIRFCYSDHDIIEALEYAQKKNIPFRIRGGRHDYEENCSVECGLVIDISPLDYVEVDLCAKTVKVGGGTPIGKIVCILAQYGYMLPTAPEWDLGVAGSTSVGGIGFSGRYLGLTCDYLREVQLIDGEGNHVIANKEVNADLFWAIKGGLGANFGILTALIYNVIPASKVVVCKALWVDCGVREAIYYWQTLCNMSDARFTSILKLTKGVNGKIELLLKGQFFGEKSELKQLILEHLGQKAFSGFYVEQVTNNEAVQILGGSIGPHPFKATGSFIYKCMTYEEISGLVEQLEKARIGGVQSIEFISVGGKIGDIGVQDTAYVHRKALYLIRINASWMTPLDSCGCVEWVNHVKTYLDRIGQGTYRGFTDFDLCDWQEQYYGVNYEELRSVKQKYDPKNILNFPQSIQ